MDQNNYMFDMHTLGTYVHNNTNMMFLCLTMWLGELYTDNANDANNDTGRH